MFKYLRILLLVIVLLLVPQFSYASQASDIESEKQRLMEVFDYILEYQLSKPEAQDLVDNAIKGMLDNLADPYNSYFDPTEYRQLMEQLSGSVTGVGMFVEEKEGYVVVQSPIKGSPAERAGLLPGDKITKVQGEDVTGQPVEIVASKIKGEAGTEAIITVLRQENGKSVERVFRIVREVVQIPVVESKLLNNNIGYIRLYSFTEQAHSQFADHLDKLKNQGMKSLILDLRNNGGGLLDSALKIAEIFIDDGIVLHVKDRDGIQESFSVDGPGWDLPVVTLVNGYSASASEILAGALRDNKVTTIVGEKSFGKGSVQQLIPLEAGGLLKITIREYFTPNHAKIDGIGIIPDVAVNHFDLQVETAQRLLGMYSTLRLTDEGKTYVNEKEYSGKKPVAIYKNGGWFISIRALSNLYGGDLVWVPETKSVVWKLKGVEKAFKADGNPNLFTQEGHLYVNVDYLVKVCPQCFTWKDTVLTFKPE